MLAKLFRHWSKTSEVKGKKHSKWLEFRLSDAAAREFNLVLYAFIVGLVAGGIGTFFRLILSYVEKFRSQLYHNAQNSHSGWVVALVFAVAAVSIALFLVRKFAPEASGSGVQEIEGALDGVRPLRWKRVIPIKFVASLFSLGSGLLLGREGPTIQLGANSGKMIKDLLKRPDSEFNTLVSAGAGAGLASAFNAPLAGVIFVIEEMHGHFRYTFFSLVAIMIASGTADLVVRTFIGPDPVIKMTVFPAPSLSMIWTFVVLGLLFSIIGYVFNKYLVKALDFFAKLSSKSMLITAGITGVTIAVIGVLFPDVIGGGYETVRLVLDHDLTLKFLILVFIGRFVLTLLSYGSGVPGGIFAPLISLGVLFGMIFGIIMKHYFPTLIDQPGIFAVAGMAGIFAATVRAPLTGLVLAVEMTSNYEMILPLILTTATASVVTAMIGNKPIYTTLLERTLNISNKQNHKTRKEKPSKDTE